MHNAMVFIQLKLEKENKESSLQEMHEQTLEASENVENYKHNILSNRVIERKSFIVA